MQRRLIMVGAGTIAVSVVIMATSQVVRRIREEKHLRVLECKNSVARSPSIEILCEMGCTRAIPSFVKLLRDKTTLFQDAVYIIETLGSWGPIAKDAVPVLIDVLRDNAHNPGIAVPAARSLGQMGSLAMAALPVLERVLEDGADEEVRNAAAKAIRQIKG